MSFSSKINSHIFGLRYIQLQTSITTPFYKVINNWTMTSLHFFEVVKTLRSIFSSSGMFFWCVDGWQELCFHNDYVFLVIV